MAENELLEVVRTKATMWLSNEFDIQTRTEVKRMLDEDEAALIDAFYRELEFGTGGLRGIMGPGTNRVNIYTIGMATQGLCNYMQKHYPSGTALKVAIAHDSRNNSRLYAKTTAAVLSANGIHAYLFEDLRPTPELSFAVRHLGCHAGIVITASHNPKEYNGYKAYWNDGGQVVPPHDIGIIREVKAIKNIGEVRFKEVAAKITILDQTIDNKYLDKIQALSLNPDIVRKHQDLKVVYTPIHGTGVHLVPAAMKRLGFGETIHVDEQDIPDGNFPTVYSPNPEEKAALDMAIEKAKSTGSDLVMASDPDADRVGIAVRGEDGEFVLLNGNQTGCLLIYYILKNWQEQGRLKGNEYIVRTIVTTPLFEKIASHFGVKTYEVLTGFKYIAELIRVKEGEEVFICGGEESYGFMLGDFVRDKDAVASCAMIAETAAWAKEEGKSLLDLLDDIYLAFGLYREHLMSITKKGRSGSEEIQAMLDRLRSQPPGSLAGSDVVMIHDFYKGKSYDQISDLRYDINLPKSNVLQFVTANGSIVSVRPSGTEPKIKFYFAVRETVNKREDLPAARQILDQRIERLIRDLQI